ncbi:MAG: hypothetical protein AB7G23_06055 [Vicinamibacterales bacterium]
MEFQVDIWLRGTNHATTEVLAPVPREAVAWTDADVAAVLAAMLRALERASNPAATDDRPVALRGFSWIVNPFEDGGVVIALELSLGAVVGGPFDVAAGALSATIERVLRDDRAARGERATVH